jgi:hypothetical protein
MGKRSNFKRIERDFYRTPELAVLPLLDHISDVREYIEPCAGDGALIDILKKYGKKCLFACDIFSQREDVVKYDLFDLSFENKTIITNPPWDRKILHPLLDKVVESKNCVAYLLFDADWMHTKQSSNYIKYCEKIISIGRVKWIEGSKMTGKDNCCWYKFVSKDIYQSVFDNTTKFFGR